MISPVSMCGNFSIKPWRPPCAMPSSSLATSAFMSSLLMSIRRLMSRSLGLLRAASSILWRMPRSVASLRIAPSRASESSSIPPNLPSSSWSISSTYSSASSASVCLVEELSTTKPLLSSSSSTAVFSTALRHTLFAIPKRVSRARLISSASDRPSI